jgi:NAD(P)-dependent dehydrogenase (short-subunit alcohol dehydrogenase family)
MRIAFTLSGKVALVAGGGAIASAAARALEENGAHVSLAAFAEAGSTLERIVEERLRLDILVNVAADGEEDAVAIVERLCRRAAATAAGRIVNVASVLGLVPVREAGAVSSRAAAIFSLTRVLAMELGDKGVLVNGLAVGAVEAGDSVGERMLSHVPLARRATLDEIAGAVLFLVDPDNSYMTGHVLAVDGGWSAGYARDF